MSVFQKIGSFFSLHDEEEELYETEPPAPTRNVVPLTQANGRRAAGTEVSVYIPKQFSDVTEIADALRNRQVVIINVQGADRSLLQRVVDFTSGVAYTLDGRIQKLAEAIFLIVPAGVTVNSQGIRESLGSDPMLDFMTNRG
jgi:cell division inhibitor SepF